MEHQIQVFDFNSQNVRIVEKDKEPWFVLKDVCDALELKRVPDVKRRLMDDVVSNHPISDALGRQQDTTIINEDGLYDVILESRKPEAKAFRKWVTRDVLPAIRKTGTYSIEPSAATPVVEKSDKQKQLQADIRRMNAETKLLQAKTDQGKVIASLMIALKERLSDEDLHILVDLFVKESQGSQSKLPSLNQIEQIYAQLKPIVAAEQKGTIELDGDREISLVAAYMRGMSDATNA